MAARSKAVQEAVARIVGVRGCVDGDDGHADDRVLVPLPFVAAVASQLAASVCLTMAGRWCMWAPSELHPVEDATMDHLVGYIACFLSCV